MPNHKSYFKGFASVVFLIVMAVGLVGATTVQVIHNSKQQVELEELRGGELEEGSISYDKLAEDVFTSVEIELPDGTTTTAKMVSGNIADGMPSGNLQLETADGEIIEGTVTEYAPTEIEVEDGSITEEKLAKVFVDRIVKLEEAEGTTTDDGGSTEIEDGSVITVKLANGAVTTEKLANGSVTTVKILDGSISSGKLQDAVVLTQHLGSSSVTSVKIKDGAITTSKLFDGVVTSLKIEDGTIANVDISDTASIAYSKLNLTSSILLGDIGQNGCASGEIMKWNGSAWACAIDTGGVGATTFLGLTDTPSGYTAGSVLFTTGSTVTEANTNLFWDNSSDRLGVGTNSPTAAIEVSAQNLGHALEVTANSDDSELEFYGFTYDAFLSVTNANSEAVIKFGSEAVVDQGWALIGRDAGENYRMDIASGVDVGHNNDIGSALMTFLQNGDVGIGTTSPNYPLHLSGVEGDGSLKIAITNTGGGREWSINSHNNGIFYISDQTAVANRLIIDTSGNVGIDTPVLPIYKLEVAGDVGINDYIYHNGDANTHTYFSPDRWQLFTGGRAMIDAQFSSSEIAINEGGTQTDFRVEGDNETHLFFTDGSTDRVGIGTATPNFRLEIVGSSSVIDRKIGINSTQVVYLPDQTSFTGSLVIGDGGTNLSHTAGADGQLNTFVGIGAGNANTTGYANTANGRGALYSNVSGYHNTATGLTALYNNNSGSFNTANGSESLENNTTGSRNTASGYFSLYSNTTGGYNTASGMYALNSNVANSRSTAMGYGAMYYADSRIAGRDTYNTAVGYEALRGSGTAANNTGQRNTAVGDSALYANTTGSYNTANGNDALRVNTTGYFNTANGVNSLYLNSTGGSNTANGVNALRNNVANSESTAVGYGAMYYADNRTSGQSTYNTAVGYEALRGSTTASANSGQRNTALGHSTLLVNSSGDSNVAVGWSALLANNSGSGNVAMGRYAMDTNTTGSNNTALGYEADVSTSGLTNATAIGNGATVNANNKVRIGDTNVSVIEGQVAWSNPSDRRLKENIEESVLGLEFINKLNPVTFNYKEGNTGTEYTGLIAQEVEAALEGVEFSGLNRPQSGDDFYSLSYSTFIVPLINAVQELDEKVNGFTDQTLSIEELGDSVASLEVRIDELGDLSEDEDFVALVERVSGIEDRLDEKDSEMNAMEQALCELGRVEFCEE